MSHLLGGRVVHAQPETGHRTGVEPVLLAAFVPARPGARVLEGGSGAGAGLLCLAARIPITGLGVEIDPALVALAEANAAANGFNGLAFMAADLTQGVEGVFDHAMANPPWHAPGTASLDSAKERAKRAGDGVLAAWARALARPLRHRGTLSWVIAADHVPDALAAFAAAGCGALALLPLWPREGRPAKLVLLRGVKGGKGPFRLLPGLVLHGPQGYTAEANAILRDGAALDASV